MIQLRNANISPWTDPLQPCKLLRQSLPWISCKQTISANTKYNASKVNHRSLTIKSLVKLCHRKPMSLLLQLGMSKFISISKFLTSIKWSLQSLPLDLAILKEQSLPIENFHFKFKDSVFVIKFSRIGAAFIYNNSQKVFIIKWFTSSLDNSQTAVPAVWQTISIADLEHNFVCHSSLGNHFPVTALRAKPFLNEYIQARHFFEIFHLRCVDLLWKRFQVFFPQSLAFLDSK